MTSNSSFQKAINCLAQLDFCSEISANSIAELAQAISSEVDAIVEAQSFDELERLLALQLKTLDSLFYQFTYSLSLLWRESDATKGMLLKHPEILEAIAQSALKAQDQSRKTALAIAELKKPRKATFIKQQLNQLVTSNNAEMDTRIQGASATLDAGASPVAEIHRAANPRRKKHVQAQCPEARG